MTCPEIGRWRAWLDEETALTGPEEHLAACGRCASAVARLRQDAELSQRALRVLAPPAHPRLPLPSHGAALEEVGPRWRALVGSAAAATLVVVLLVATPGGRALADSVLSVFRTQRVDLVMVTAADLAQTASVIERLGDLEGDGIPSPVPVASRQEAETRSGLRLPAALEADAYLAVDPATVRWRLDGARIASYLAETGSEIALPDELDGTTLVLERGAAVMAVQGSLEAPDLVFARSAGLEARAEGPASLLMVREFLLSLPGLPETLVSQLRAITDWRSTLPLPVPVDHASGQSVMLGGVEAVEVDVTDVGTGYLWADSEGIVTGVAGADPDAVHRLALDAAASG